MKFIKKALLLIGVKLFCCFLFLCFNDDKLFSFVKNLADEIISVDTGSVDRTKEIVLNYTDQIFDFE